jgi:translation initiation factor IF-1
MARDDLLQSEGVVAEVLAAGYFLVRLDTGQEISTRLSGRMRKFSIRVILGDRVTVGISPYDVTHGLIIHRQKLAPRGPAPRPR